MKKLFDNYAATLTYGEIFKQAGNFQQNGFINSYSPQQLRTDDEIYTVNWGVKNSHSKRGCAIETGFFLDAMHADNFGLYELCSLNFQGVRKIIENYEPKVTAKQFQKEKKLNSKFKQGSTENRWNKIVFMCQYPKDRSVQRAGYSAEQYFKFVDKACRFYGKNLLLKLHPVNGKEDTKTYQEIGKRYGCEAIRCGTEIINDCEFVLLFNSTVSVDCFLANKPVLQYAPGYFWRTGTVDYSEQTFRDPRNLDLNYNQKFCDFLIWKYCFRWNTTAEVINKIFDVFSTSNSLFPLPEELSYGASL